MITDGDVSYKRVFMEPDLHKVMMELCTRRRDARIPTWFRSQNKVYVQAFLRGSSVFDIDDLVQYRKITH